MRLWVAVLVGMYGIAAYLAAAFLHSQVAPCLGLGEVRACFETWLVHRSVLEALLDTPYPYVAAFLAASALTIRVALRRQRR
jgi:hypothetical protein